MTVRNLLLSLVLSLVLAFVLTVLYVFSPIISLLLRGMFSSEPHTDGVAAVAGGASAALVWTMPLLAVAVFLIVFAFLQRRSRRSLE
jgi:hypothetical protein